MAYIQKLPIPGTGKKLFPDAAMDAGTRGLIDMIDGWSWGGQSPADGATVPTGEGPKNYPLAEDGWVEDAASAAQNLTFQGGGLRFTGKADYLKLPRGFEIKTTDTDIGLILWVKNIAHPEGVNGFVNSVFASVADKVQNFAVNFGYTDGAATGCVVRSQRTGGVAVPTAFMGALLDSQLRQVAVRFSVNSGNGDFAFYVDGAQVGVVSAAIINPWQARIAGDYAALGRHHIFAGGGLNGRAFRALFQQLDKAEVRPFSETVALDYGLNSNRILSALGG